MKFIIFLRTIVSYILLACISPFFIVPCFLIACLPYNLRINNRFFYWLLYWFYKSVLLLTFNPLKIHGNSTLRYPVIFVGNHQSSMDIPVMGMLSHGYPHMWFVLKYYINTPVLGFFIKRMFVPVNRETEGAAASSLMKLLELMHHYKGNLIIFPEGGRYNDGTVHTFYKGFALIAQQSGYPVIPVYMPNNGKIYPPYSFLIYRHPFEVIIGPPFWYQANDTDAEFTQRVRDWFLQQVERNYD